MILKHQEIMPFLHITPEGIQVTRLHPERKIFVGKQDITNANFRITFNYPDRKNKAQSYNDQQYAC